METNVIMSDKIENKIKNILEYMREMEFNHFEESDKPKDHIYRDVIEVKKWLKEQRETQSTTQEAKEIKSYYAVIRLEAQDENDEKAQEECDDFEFQSEKAEAYLKYLEQQKELINSGYIGNAYFLETTKKERINRFHKILKEDTKEEVPTRSKISIEWNYFPDWADEIIKQSQEEDEE